MSWSYDPFGNRKSQSGHCSSEPIRPEARSLSRIDRKNKVSTTSAQKRVSKIVLQRRPFFLYF
jgi:hypothetical protein